MTFTESAWLLVIGGAISAFTAIAAQITTSVRDGRKQTREIASAERLQALAGQQKIAEGDRARAIRQADLLTDASRDAAKVCLEGLVTLEEDFDRQLLDQRAKGTANSLQFEIPLQMATRIKASATLIDHRPTDQAVQDVLFVVTATYAMIMQGYTPVGDEAPHWLQRSALESGIRVVASYVRGEPDESGARGLASLRKDAEAAMDERYGK